MAGLTAAIFFNALVMQTGSHPAPFFPSRSAPKLATAPARPSPAPQIGMAPADLATVKSVQVALTLRGFYDGTPDGVPGPKTVAAIRSFQDSAGLTADGIPTEALLQAVLARPVVDAAGRPDQIGALITASTPSPPARRLVSVEKALAALGYGPLKVDGLMDDDTRESIERFERDRGLPVTGQVSARLARELTAVSGLAVE